MAFPGNALAQIYSSKIESQLWFACSWILGGGGGGGTKQALWVFPVINCEVCFPPRRPPAVRRATSGLSCLSLSKRKSCLFLHREKNASICTKKLHFQFMSVWTPSPAVVVYCQPSHFHWFSASRGAFKVVKTLFNVLCLNWKNPVFHPTLISDLSE